MGKTMDAVRCGLLTVDDAAELLSLKPATIRSWVLHRKIGYTKIGRAVRISIEEVQRIIEQGSIPANKNLAS